MESSTAPPGALPQLTALSSPDPDDARALDWLRGRALVRRRVLLGVLGCPQGVDGVADAAALRLTIVSSIRELAWLAPSTSGLLAVVLRGPPTRAVQGLLDDFLGVGGAPPRPSPGAAPVYMHAIFRRLDAQMAVVRGPSMDVIVLIPNAAIDEEAAWAWLLRGVATRANPRYVVAMQAGAAFAPRGLWRLYTAAEAAPRAGGLLGAFAPAAVALPCNVPSPLSAVQEADAAGSESADALCAAVALPPRAPPFRVTLFRWEALTAALEGPDAPSPLGRALGRPANPFSAAPREGSRASPPERLLFELAAEPGAAWEVSLVPRIGELPAPSPYGPGLGAFLSQQARSWREWRATHERAALQLLPAALGCGGAGRQHSAAWRIAAASQGGRALLALILAALAPALLPLAVLVAFADACALGGVLPDAACLLPAGPLGWAPATAAPWVLLGVPAAHLGVLAALAAGTSCCRPRWATPGAAALRAAFVVIALVYALLALGLAGVFVAAAAVALAPGAAPVAPFSWGSPESRGGGALLLLAAAAQPGIAVCVALLASGGGLCAAAWAAGGCCSSRLWTVPITALDAFALGPACATFAAAAACDASPEHPLREVTALSGLLARLHAAAVAEVSGLSAAAAASLLVEWRGIVEAAEEAASKAAQPPLLASQGHRRRGETPRPQLHLSGGGSGDASPRRSRSQNRTARDSLRSAATASTTSRRWIDLRDAVADSLRRDLELLPPVGCSSHSEGGLPLGALGSPGPASPRLQPGAVNPFVELVHTAQTGTALLGCMLQAAIAPSIMKGARARRGGIIGMSASTNSVDVESAAAAERVPVSRAYAVALALHAHAVLRSQRDACDAHPAAPASQIDDSTARRRGLSAAQLAVASLREPLDLHSSIAARDVQLNRLAPRLLVLKQQKQMQAARENAEGGASVAAVKPACLGGGVWESLSTDRAGAAHSPHRPVANLKDPSSSRIPERSGWDCERDAGSPALCIALGLSCYPVLALPSAVSGEWGAKHARAVPVPSQPPPSRLTLTPEHAALLALIPAPGAAPASPEALAAFDRDCAAALRALRTDAARADSHAASAFAHEDDSRALLQSDSDLPISCGGRGAAASVASAITWLLFNALIAVTAIWADPSLRWTAAVGSAAALGLSVPDVLALALGAGRALAAELGVVLRRRAVAAETRSLALRLGTQRVGAARSSPSPRSLAPRLQRAPTPRIGVLGSPVKRRGGGMPSNVQLRFVTTGTSESSPSSTAQGAASAASPMAGAASSPHLRSPRPFTPQGIPPPVYTTVKLTSVIGSRSLSPQSLSSGSHSGRTTPRPANQHPAQALQRVSLDVGTSPGLVGLAQPRPRGTPAAAQVGPTRLRSPLVPRPPHSVSSIGSTSVGGGSSLSRASGVTGALRVRISEADASAEARLRQPPMLRYVDTHRSGPIQPHSGALAPYTSTLPAWGRLPPLEGASLSSVSAAASPVLAAPLPSNATEGIRGRCSPASPLSPTTAAGGSSSSSGDNSGGSSNGSDGLVVIDVGPSPVGVTDISRSPASSLSPLPPSDGSRLPRVMALPPAAPPQLPERHSCGALDPQMTPPVHLSAPRSPPPINVAAATVLQQLRPTESALRRPHSPGEPDVHAATSADDSSTPLSALRAAISAHSSSSTQGGGVEGHSLS